MGESEINYRTGRLFLVATPIGNLDDITIRAIETLKSSDIICAEDTRHTRKLLNRICVSTKPVSYRDENAVKMAPRIVEWVTEGKTVAIVSDAGTPGISDPGFRATRAIIDAGLPVEMIPGPTSIAPALVLSGLGVDRFCFEGFLPVKKGRKTRFEELSREKRTMIIFEGPHKLKRTLKDLGDFLGLDRLISVARELTKIHEEFHRGTIFDLNEHFSSHEPKGEMVIVIEGLEAYMKRLKKSGDC